MSEKSNGMNTGVVLLIILLIVVVGFGAWYVGKQDSSPSASMRISEDGGSMSIETDGFKFNAEE